MRYHSDIRDGSAVFFVGRWTVDLSLRKFYGVFMIPILSGVAPLASNYDAWFCDIWGVMHDGQKAFKEAVEACRAFQAQGGRVVLLTNAPRPAFSVADQLQDFGVPPDCYDGIVSSGDVAQHLIKAQDGKAIHHIGPARDDAVIEQAKISPVPLVEGEVILMTGLIDDDNETPEDYRERLEGPAGRAVVMICANPDLMVERGSRLIYCAGAVAALYEDMGGRVLYAGKPYLPVYELAIDRLSEIMGRVVDPSRVLCIGDGVKTDMPGAFNAKLDALFVASQLHVEDRILSDEILENIFQSFEDKPVGALSKLCW